MAKVREVQWVPHLRKLIKQVFRNCWGCKRFQAVAAPHPPAGPLLRDRTEGADPFSVIGVDFTAPVKYLQQKSKEQKGVHCDIFMQLTLRSILGIATKPGNGRIYQKPQMPDSEKREATKIYSDNGRTFIAAANWLKKVRKDERLNIFLGTHEITWQFNLSRTPWWGGQFVR